MFAAYNSGRTDGKLELQRQQYEQRLEQDNRLKRYYEEREKIILRIAQDANAAAVRANAALTRAAQREQEFDSLLASLAPLTPAECAPLVDTLTKGCKAVIAEKDTALTKQALVITLTREALDSSEAARTAEHARANDLATDLRRAVADLDKQRCVIRFPVKICPSPTVTFFTGAALGAVGGFVLNEALDKALD